MDILCICNGKICKDCCSLCRYTSDIAYANNFEIFKFEDNGGKVTKVFTEITTQGDETNVAK